jgi:hypothetical protein
LSDRSSSPRVTFDLEKGRVHLADARDDSARMVVVPAAALARLLTAAKSEGVDVGRALGEAIGARIGPKEDANASIDHALTSIAEELGLLGLGVVSLEKWGRALIVVIDDAADLGDEFLAAVIEGTLAKATSRQVHARSLGRSGSKLRVFVGRAATVERLGKFIDEGIGWGDAIVRLHESEARA